MLRHNLKTLRAYCLKEAFQQLWDRTRPPRLASSSTIGAAKSWSHIEPMKKFAHTKQWNTRIGGTISLPLDLLRAN